MFRHAVTCVGCLCKKEPGCFEGSVGRACRNRLKREEGIEGHLRGLRWKGFNFLRGELSWMTYAKRQERKFANHSLLLCCSVVLIIIIYDFTARQSNFFFLLCL